MDFLEKLLESVCKPIILYNVFVIALIIFNISQGDLRSLFKNSVFLVVGTGLLWTLCYLGFSPVAWVLLSLPVFFVVAILALLVLTQIIKTDVEYDECGDKYLVGGRNWMRLFGFKDRDSRQQCTKPKLKPRPLPCGRCETDDI